MGATIDVAAAILKNNDKILIAQRADKDPLAGCQYNFAPADRPLVEKLIKELKY